MRYISHNRKKIPCPRPMEKRIAYYICCTYCQIPKIFSMPLVCALFLSLLSTSAAGFPLWFVVKWFVKFWIMYKVDPWIDTTVVKCSPSCETVCFVLFFNHRTYICRCVCFSHLTLNIAVICLYISFLRAFRFIFGQHI